MTSYRKSSFPPSEEWDSRMSEVGCLDLKPIEKVHHNDWFEVYNRGGYYTIEYPFPHVIVLPIVDQKSIVMVRVKRPVIDDVSLELPAGCADKETESVEGAARELAEETGISIEDMSRFIPMPPLAVAPNRMPKLIYVFRVDLTLEEYEARLPHDHEVEGVECVSFKEAATMISKGEIYVSVPVAVIGSYLLSRNLEQL